MAIFSESWGALPIILGELGSNHILLEFERALPQKTKYFSGTWGDQSIIFRHLGSFDPHVGASQLDNQEMII